MGGGPSSHGVWPLMQKKTKIFFIFNFGLLFGLFVCFCKKKKKKKKKRGASHWSRDRKGMDLGYPGGLHSLDGWVELEEFSFTGSAATRLPSSCSGFFLFLFPHASPPPTGSTL